jgi:hypothetical protein
MATDSNTTWMNSSDPEHPMPLRVGLLLVQLLWLSTESKIKQFLRVLSASAVKQT